MAESFVGTIDKGQLKPDMPGNYSRWLATLEGQRVTIEIKKFRKNRTDAQNRYWWSVVIDILSKHTGYEPEEMHDAIKIKFLPVHKAGLIAGKSTARLTTIEFVELIEQVQRWAAQDLQCYIPDPNEEVTEGEKP
jgi:hypothetical protein